MAVPFRGRRGSRGPRERNTGPAHRINERIRVPQVRLVGFDGEMIGVTPTVEAIRMAQDAGVDLVEISPKAEPPVCKIIDYGKMLYALKKKEQQQKKATKAQEQKGIRLTFRMDSGDVERQRKHTQEFLENGHPVRLQMILRGRENIHKNLAFEKFKAFISSLEEHGKVEQQPSSNRNQIIAILKPLTK